MRKYDDDEKERNFDYFFLFIINKYNKKINFFINKKRNGWDGMGWKRKKEKEEKTNLKLSATRMISVFLVSGLCILYIFIYFSFHQIIIIR